MKENRLKDARERAGLSLGRAAELLAVDKGDLARGEILDSHAHATLDLDRCATLYQVRREWLTGDVERYDHASVDKIRGAEDLTPHDRDVIAEFAASMPRKS